MRCNWRRWLWGILPLLALSWAAVEAEHGQLERDLAERAGMALAQAGLGWATIEFNARDGILTGQAPQEGEPAKAAQSLRGVWGIRLIENRAGLIEKAEQYLWWATRRNNRIRLSGYVPSPSARAAILGVTKASFPGFEVVDRMTLARGMPAMDIWLGGVSFALQQLASLKRGDVRLDNLSLGVAGEAEDGGAYRAVKLALSDGLPKGIALSGERVTPPVVSPYTWAAKFSEGRLALTGNVPSEEDRAKLLAAAEAGVAGALLLDQMQPGEGAPQGFIAAAMASVRELARLEQGNAELRDGVLVVSGLASDSATADAVRARLRAALPASIKLTEQIRPKEPAPAAAPAQAAAAQAPEASPPSSAPVPGMAGKSASAPAAPPASEPASAASGSQERPPQAIASGGEAGRSCAEALANAAKSGTILFRLGSAQLEDASLRKLDQLAQSVKSCPGMLLEVGGHASAEGGAGVNRQLAVRRAQSVVAYLIRAGVDQAQLQSVGFGTTRPAAPNDTAEHMAQNRRIEFTVRAKEAR
jgi:outer membrane protein OmpA-like peptidoglycan-associated protein